MTDRIIEVNKLLKRIVSKRKDLLPGECQRISLDENAYRLIDSALTLWVADLMKLRGC